MNVYLFLPINGYLKKTLMVNLLFPGRKGTNPIMGIQSFPLVGTIQNPQWNVYGYFYFPVIGKY